MDNKLSAKRSRGRQCVVPDCNSYEYDKDGTRSLMSFFKFPTKGPRKARWCNLIKRQDGRDGFRITEKTVICDNHLKKDDVKKSIGGVRVKLVNGKHLSSFTLLDRLKHLFIQCCKFQDYKLV